MFAEDGTYHNYKVNVYRSPYLNYDDASLSNIKENLKGSLSPAFNKETNDYNLKAQSSENSVRIEVTPVNSNAIVIIDDEERKRVTYSIGNGRMVKIEVVSPDGLKRTYRVFVER